MFVFKIAVARNDGDSNALVGDGKLRYLKELVDVDGHDVGGNLSTSTVTLASRSRRSRCRRELADVDGHDVGRDSSTSTATMSEGNDLKYVQ